MLIDKFRSKLKQAIQDYSTRYKGEDMPTHRKEPCETIIGYCNNLTLNQLQLKHAIQGELNRLKTGFWIIKTGNSRLKAKLQTVLNDKDFSNAAFYLESVNQLNQALSRIKQLEMGITFSQQRAYIQTLENENVQLKRQCKNLQQQIGELEQEVFTYQNELAQVDRASPTDSLFSEYARLSHASASSYLNQNTFFVAEQAQDLTHDVGTTPDENISLRNLSC